MESPWPCEVHTLSGKSHWVPPPPEVQSNAHPYPGFLQLLTLTWGTVSSWVLEVEEINAGTRQAQGGHSGSWAEGLLVFGAFLRAGDSETGQEIG